MKVSYGPRIDFSYCNGCKECYENCPMDVFGWDEPAKRPTVDYPAECSLCCVCEITCAQRAVDVRFPLHSMLDFGIDPKKAVRQPPEER